jgi:hypothetical protein
MIVLDTCALLWLTLDPGKFRTPYLGEVKVTPLSGFSDPTNL